MATIQCIVREAQAEQPAAPAPQPTPPPACPPPPPATKRPMEEVKRVLAAINLAQYADAFDKEGYDDLRHLASFDGATLAKVAREIGMKPGHALRFVDQFKAGAERLLSGWSLSWGEMGPNQQE